LQNSAQNAFIMQVAGGIWYHWLFD